jgi:hypothetical protein
VLLENDAWNAHRQAWWTTITPCPGHLNSWVHFTIPSPSSKDVSGIKSVRAAIRFQTGSGATVRQFLVADGEIVRLNAENLELVHPQMAVYSRDIPNEPQVAHSLVICLQIEFNGLTPQDYIRLSWAEVAFADLEAKH